MLIGKGEVIVMNPNASLFYFGVNQNLEAMAKQLYDYWFVQFDFPNENGKPYKSSGGKMVWNEKLKQNIPDGWNVAKLIDVAEIKNGATPSTTDKSNYGGEVVWITPKDLSDQQSKFVYSGSRNITNKGLTSCSTSMLPLESVLLSSRAPIGLISIAKTRLCTNQGFKNIVPNNISESLYFYYYVKQHIKQIEQLGSGTTFKEVSRESLSTFPILVASNCKKFSEWIEIEKSISKKQFILTKEIALLTKQRDEFLPLLMNGQVEVNSDLLQFAYIIEALIIIIMKNSIIQTITNAMQRELDYKQMARLKEVLNNELSKVEMSEHKDNETNRELENSKLLDSFIAAKKIEGCSEKTLLYYRNTIEKMLSVVQMAICHIETSSIRGYLSEYQERNKSSKVTIDNMRRIFSSFFAWLEDEDYIAKSPVRRIHKVKTDSLVKEVLSDEQLELLRDNCTEKRDLAIIDLLSSTGIRVGELVKLNRSDIDFHERQCVVFGKGNKERTVYFNARTKIHLDNYLSSRTDDNEALFVSLKTPFTRLSISGVEVRMKELGKQVQISKVHPHKFRRTLATMAIDKGMPIEQVQKLLGHVRIDTTLHYAMVNQNNVKMAHRKYLG